MRITNSLQIVSQKSNLLRSILPTIVDEVHHKAAADDLLYYDLIVSLDNPMLAELFVVARMAHAQMRDGCSAQDAFYEAVSTLEELNICIVH